MGQNNLKFQYMINGNAILTDTSCRDLGIKISDNNKFEDYISDITRSAFFRLRQFGIAFSCKDNLRRHQIELHTDRINTQFIEKNNARTLFECNQCKENFKRKSDLKRHVSCAHGEKNLVCTLCPAKFSRKDSLKRHVKTKHQDDEKNDGGNAQSPDQAGD